MSKEQVNNYRLKIKQLKYKIEKEQKNCDSLKQQISQFKNITKTQLSIERVMGKIHFALQMKGLSIRDWLNAVPYGNETNNGDLSLTELLDLLQKMNIKLEADQKYMLLDECTNSLSQNTTIEQVIQCAQRCGLSTNQ